MNKDNRMEEDLLWRQQCRRQKKEKKRGTAENFIFSKKRLNGTQRKRDQCEIKTITQKKKERVMQSHLLAVLPHVDANTQQVEYVRGVQSEKM